MFNILLKQRNLARHACDHFNSNLYPHLQEKPYNILNLMLMRHENTLATIVMSLTQTVLLLETPQIGYFI